MAKNGFCLVFYVLSAIVLSKSVLGSLEDERKEYIVYIGALPDGVYSPNDEHLTLLQQVVEESAVSNSLVRSYTRSFNGFAARLTEAEARELGRRDEVVSVFPSQTLHIQTTRSWDFVGLPVKAKRQKLVESDIIIGVIDSGLWPELDSFSDKGFGPPPKKWKGACNPGSNFSCNNKVIGARFYGQTSFVRDDNAHGSHTASTAAGNVVLGANFYGLANGTLRGGVPSARISAYRVCNFAGQCQTSDILAAFDDAIADGVDIITISIGTASAKSFDQDVISIGSFHALEKGILTTHSAGNSGPSAGSVASVAPWLFSVAATSTDRRFIDQIVLGNGTTYQGGSINSFSSTPKSGAPLAYGKQVMSSLCMNEEDAKNCFTDCLDAKKVKGKIVLCDVAEGLIEASNKGSLGVILEAGILKPELPAVLPLPGTVFTEKDYKSITSYLNSSKNPQAQILKSVAIRDSLAPKVADFSSRGPNLIVNQILKPDISAPGVNILAGYTPLRSPSSFNSDKRQSKLNFMSGTSMACPHVAGAAAYVKTFHPNWSPSAIKSALMTSATQMFGSRDENGFLPEFAFGSGIIHPVRALNPGLVYETSEEDYIKFLCSLGYDARLISTSKVACPKGSNGTFPAAHLNYPNLMFEVPKAKPFTISLNRTVTNVGPANSTYKAEIISLNSSPVKAGVVPSVLSFKSLNQKKTFTVTVSGRSFPSDGQVPLKLSWSNGRITVNSTIIVYAAEAFDNIS